MKIYIENIQYNDNQHHTTHDYILTISNTTRNSYTHIEINYYNEKTVHAAANRLQITNMNEVNL